MSTDHSWIDITSIEDSAGAMRSMVCTVCGAELREPIKMRCNEVDYERRLEVVERQIEAIREDAARIIRGEE